MLEFPAPEIHWKSSRALTRAREAALAYARRRLAERRASASGVPSLAMLDVHLGQHHLRYFQDQFPQLIAALPSSFRALEVGAGMAWHACLLAAHGTGRVLATEIGWTRQSPHSLNNIHVLHRLAQQEPRLGEVLRFGFQGDQLTSVALDERITLATASAHALPAADSSLDLVYSHNCVEHIPDLNLAFDETARVLKIGGLFFAGTEPLYYSAEGHHLADFFPLPWGHLLWPPDELADLIIREAGTGREWAPGDPLSPHHLTTILRTELNYATPARIRSALRRSPWRIRGWVDLYHPAAKQMACQIGLFDALKDIPAEALLLTGLRFLLERTRRPEGLQLPLRLPFTTRRLLRGRF